MKKRLITSAVILLGLAFAFVCRIWTLYVFDLLILSLAVMGVNEIARAIERQHKSTNFIAVSTMPAVLYLGFILLTVNNYTWQYLLILLLGAIVIYFAVIFIVALLAKETTKKEMAKYELTDVKPVKFALDKAIYSLGIMVYPTLLFIALIMLNHFTELSFVSAKNLDFRMFTWFILTSVFVVTMITDTLAYIVGSLLKGPKLCPLISPNKTISGAIGGLFGGTLGGMALYGLFTLNSRFVNQLNLLNDNKWWEFLIIFFIGSIITQIGDIIASALKRQSRIKDYGTIFPGHGGVMDRVDGLTLNALFSFVAFTMLFLI